MSFGLEHRAQHLRWWRGHHALVWWITASSVAFSLAYSILTPVYRAPDEQKHVDMIVRYGSSLGYPDPRVREFFEPGVWGSTRLAGPNLDPELGFRPPLSVEMAQPRGFRPTFRELAESQDPSAIPRRNQLTQHPPLYYVLASSVGSFVGAVLPEEAWTWDREVWLYRTLSVVLVTPLPLLAAAAARVLSISSHETVMAAAAMFLIPMLSYIGAVVNNDATVILGTAVAVTAGVVHLVRPSWKSAAVAAGGAAVAAWSKSTGATSLPWVLLVVLVAAVPVWRAGRRREALVHLGVATSIAVVGAGRYLTNLVRFGDPQPSSFTRRVIEGAETPLWPFLQTWFERVGGTFWGQPARRTGVTLAGWVVTSLTVAVVLATVSLVVVVAFRRRHRLVVVLLGVLGLVQLGLLFRANLGHYLRTGGYAAMQGRYLYSVLVPLALLLALFLAEVVPKRVRRWAVATAIAIGAALHLVLAGAMLDRFWVGKGVGGRVESVLAWSPLPDGGSLVVLALPFVIIAFMSIAVLRSGLAESRLTDVLIGSRGATWEPWALVRRAVVACGVVVAAAALMIAVVD